MWPTTCEASCCSEGWRRRGWGIGGAGGSAPGRRGHFRAEAAVHIEPERKAANQRFAYICVECLPTEALVQQQRTTSAQHGEAYTAWLIL